MNKIIFLVFFILTPFVRAQIKTDSLVQTQKSTLKYEAFIVPVALIGYGIVGLESHTLKDLNQSTNNELKEHIDTQFTIDDISQYSPFLAVYALNAVGIKGKNNFKDRTVVLGTAYLIMGASVNIIKRTSNVERPDGSSNNSFPSGHTATAFMGAEFLYQEYKDVSIWYGVTGYAVAAGTGFFRMYNDRHWITDIAAGAGIGIVSTKLAYLLHPLIKKTIFKEKDANGLILPFYNGKEVGVGMSLVF
ncbi:MAG: phosphatase PAP2 family protein [Aequorivita sp.]|nr:phosphatase PAP2 family protein [Aequorivita sp.]